MVEVVVVVVVVVVCSVGVGGVVGDGCARRCSRHRLRDGAVEMSERRLLTPAGGKASSPARRKPPSPSRAGKSGRACRHRSAESM